MKDNNGRNGQNGPVNGQQEREEALFDFFWSRHPALFYGLSALLSFYYTTDHHLITLLLIIALSLTCAKGFRRLPLRLLLVWGLNISVIVYGSTVYKLPEIPLEGIKGTIHFKITSLSPAEGHFGRQLIYRGTGKYFIPDIASKPTLDAKNFCCSVFYPNLKIFIDQKPTGTT